MINTHIGLTDKDIEKCNDIIQLKSWKKQLKECNKTLKIKPNEKFKTINGVLLEKIECRLKQISKLYRWVRL